MTRTELLEAAFEASIALVCSPRTGGKRIAAYRRWTEALLAVEPGLEWQFDAARAAKARA